MLNGDNNYKNFNYCKRIAFDANNSTSLGNTNKSPAASPFTLITSSGAYFIVLNKNVVGNGTAFSFFGNSNDAFQFKPSMRIQSGNRSGTFPACAIDVFSSGNTSHTDYFPSGEWPVTSAFMVYCNGLDNSLNARINSKPINSRDTCTTGNTPTAVIPDVSFGMILGKRKKSAGSGGGSDEYCSSHIAEIITYRTKHSSTEIDKIESYLAIKYGITRGNNSGTSTAYNYVASDGTTIFNKSLNTGYNNDIAGIGRDDASGLRQRQSISVNTGEILTIGLGTIASENSANPNNFATDRSFLMWGNNGLPTYSVASTQIPIASLPAGIESRIQRIWKTQATNLGATYPLVTVGFEVSGLVNYTSVSNLRLLLDEDGVDWSNALVVSGASVNGSRIEFSGVQLTSARPYLTLASINKSDTPLPVELLEFDGNCTNEGVNLTWATASETNNQYFNIERSKNETDWTIIAEIPGANNSNTIKKYCYLDFESAGQNNYYRLSQRDYNGEREVFAPIYVNCNKLPQDINCYPNPFTDQIVVSWQNIEAEQGSIVLHDITGRVVLRQNMNLSDLEHKTIELSLSHLASGTYSLTVYVGNAEKIMRIVKK